MLSIEKHLVASRPGFAWRRNLHLRGANFPAPLRKPIRKLLWTGGLGHLRRFEHDYSFVRSATAVSAMDHHGREVVRSHPLDRLIGKIDRPVTLVTAGPSARDHDWEDELNGTRFVATVSGCATFLREYGVVPDLLVLSDPDFCESGGYHIADARHVPLIVEYRAAAALHRHYPEAFESRPVSIVERVNKWYGVPSLSHPRLERANAASGCPFEVSNVKDSLGRSGWSHKPELGFFPSSTVAFVALQMLVALGADDIRIVGMDLGGNVDRSIYPGSRPNRLREQYEESILPSFLAMSSALRGRGVMIKNLSPTCPLPAEVFKFS